MKFRFHTEISCLTKFDSSGLTLPCCTALRLPHLIRLPIVLLYLVILQCTSRMTQVSNSASSGTVRESEFQLFLSNCHRLTLYDVPKSPADRFCFVG